MSDAKSLIAAGVLMHARQHARLEALPPADKPRPSKPRMPLLPVAPDEGPPEKPPTTTAEDLPADNSQSASAISTTDPADASCHRPIDCETPHEAGQDKASEKSQEDSAITDCPDGDPNPTPFRPASPASHQPQASKKDSSVPERAIVPKAAKWSWGECKDPLAEPIPLLLDDAALKKIEECVKSLPIRSMPAKQRSRLIIRRLKQIVGEEDSSFHFMRDISRVVSDYYGFKRGRIWAIIRHCLLVEGPCDSRRAGRHVERWLAFFFRVIRKVPALRGTFPDVSAAYETEVARLLQGRE